MSVKKLTPISSKNIKDMGVQALATRPNKYNQYGASGLSAEGLKLWFDKLSTFLAEKHNELLKSLNGEDAAQYIPVLLESAGITSMQELIDALKNGEFAAKVLMVMTQVNGTLEPLQTLLYRLVKDLGTHAEDLKTLGKNKVNKTARVAGVDLQDDITAAELKKTLSIDKVNNTSDEEKPVSKPQSQAIENVREQIPTNVSALTNDTGYLTESDFASLFYQYMLIHGVNAYCDISEGLAYTLSEDESYYIVSGIGECKDAEVIIPPYYQTLPVRRIAAEAFKSNMQIVSVIIPNSVTYIGDYAFQYCSYLERATLGNGVSAVGVGVFDHCEKLRDVNLSKSLAEIGEAMFFYCTSLESVVIEGATSIGDSAFGYCSGLCDIVIPKSVEQIKSYAFYNCTLLRNVNLYALTNLTEIGDFVFYGCASLSQITVPQATAYIGESAFAHCYGLEIVRFCGNNTSLGASAFSECTGLATVDTLEHTDTSGGVEIGESAFEGCTSLETAWLSGRISEIAARAFFGCSSLADFRSVSGNYRFLNIGAYAFANCQRLSAEWLAKCYSLTSIAKFAFDGCTAIEEITIPNSATVEVGAFKGCVNVKTMTYALNKHIGHFFGGTTYTANASCTPQSLKHVNFTGTVIPARALCECASIESFSAADTIVTVEKYAFWKCTALCDAVIPDNCNMIDTNAFQYCSSLVSVVLGKKVATLGDFAFDYCFSLQNVHLSEALTSMGKAAFRYCSSLREISIPAGVKTIGQSTFKECTSLHEVNISEGMETFDNYAFNHCISLGRIVLPSTMKAIAYYAFQLCSNLTTIYCRFSSGTVSGAPWNADYATIVYDYTGE